MKRLGLAVLFLLGLCTGALAQQQTVKLCVPTSGTACPVVSASAPLPVSGSFSATLSGFTPNGNYATLTATAASSASTALPAGTSVAFQNLSTVDVSCVLSSGTATATTNKIIVRGGATVFVTVGSNANAACINQTGSASNVVAMAGGSGLGTNFGGGGGGGGGGAVTVADGADITQGALADAACGTATGTCSVVSLLKYLNNAVNSPIPSGTFTIGDVGISAARTTSPVSGLGVGATAAAPPANAAYLGANASGATGGLLAGLKTCDLHAKYDASTSGSTTMVTGVSGRKVYICGFILATGGTATNVKLREGSDANCATNAADLTPAYQLVANDKIGMQAAFWTGLAVSTNAYYVCVNASAANAVQAEIWYTIQ